MYPEIIPYVLAFLLRLPTNVSVDFRLLAADPGLCTTVACFDRSLPARSDWQRLRLKLTHLRTKHSALKAPEEYMLGIMRAVNGGIKAGYSMVLADRCFMNWPKTLVHKQRRRSSLTYLGFLLQQGLGRECGCFHTFITTNIVQPAFVRTEHLPLLALCHLRSFSSLPHSVPWIWLRVKATRRINRNASRNSLRWPDDLVPITNQYWAIDCAAGLIAHRICHSRIAIG